MSRARELVAFVVDGRRCAVDLAVVERVEPMVAVSPLPGAPAGVLGAVDVRGTVIPVLDLRARLDLPPADATPDAALVLARTARRTVALPVDEALGVLTVESVQTLDAAVGVATLPDGLLYIHDLERFLSADAERELDLAVAAR